MGELDAFRKAKDDFFAADPRSPLKPEQRESFDGLAYFEEDPRLLIEAELDTNVEAGTVLMPTTTGTEQTYRRAGVVRFDVDGQPAQVTLFASDAMPDLFLPFRDATSGRESYPAGRYLEVEPPRNRTVRVDFNLAYNPYCAYNESWSCPIPPAENWLTVPIRAGEKDFPGRADQ